MLTAHQSENNLRISTPATTRGSHGRKQNAPEVRGPAETKDKRLVLMEREEQGTELSALRLIPSCGGIGLGLRAL